MIDRLRDRLSAFVPGPIPDEDVGEVLAALGESWDHFEGSKETSMDSSKLHRAESLEWDPPILRFLIERHGRTVSGSTRADLQQWEVDVSAGIVELHSSGWRQVRPMGSRWNAKAARSTAEEIANAIRADQNDPRLRWTKDRRKVLVLTSMAVPQGPAETVRGRVRRLHTNLEQILGPTGWTRGNSYWYVRPGESANTS